MARERFRRMLVGGYDPAQVRAAIDERDERLRQVEREAKHLAQRAIEAERRLRAAAIGGPDATPGPLGAFSRRLEEIHEQARRQATRIRMSALEDVVRITDRISELSKLRDELGARVSELAGLAGTGRTGADERPAVGTEPALGAIDGVYSGTVDVEFGPLRDFAQLSLFQDAAAAIDGASEIKVRRVSGGRATVSMNLDNPVELLRELEERAPFEFKVRDTRGDGIVLDLDDADADGRHAA